MAVAPIGVHQPKAAVSAGVVAAFVDQLIGAWVPGWVLTIMHVSCIAVAIGPHLIEPPAAIAIAGAGKEKLVTGWRPGGQRILHIVGKTEPFAGAQVKATEPEHILAGAVKGQSHAARLHLGLNGVDHNL